MGKEYGYFKVIFFPEGNDKKNYKAYKKVMKHIGHSCFYNFLTTYHLFG